MATHFEALAQPLLSSPHLQCVGEAARRTIAKYVKNQGNEYHKLHSDHQLALF